jgi:hypothetical protein
VSPSFGEIGKLGAIAAIRTVLNSFLAQEIERAKAVVERDRPRARQPATVSGLRA